MRKLDLDSWVRRSLFENFCGYADPFLSLTAVVGLPVTNRREGGDVLFGL